MSSAPPATVSGRKISNEAAVPIYAEVQCAVLWGLLVNTLLGVTKLISGVVTNSFALISDAVNSLGDVLTSLAVLVALRYAQKPPDAKHPYGHTRAEAIAGANVALLVFLSAVWVAWEAVLRLPTHHEVPPGWTLWIAGGNVLIKEGLYRYKRSVAKRTQSTVILAHAWDHRADAFSAFAALLGILVIRLGGSAYMWADEVAALVIVGAIWISTAKLFRAAASELMDAQADAALIEEVRTRSLETSGVLGIETLWIRKSGLEYLADIHVEVDPNISVKEGHQIGHDLRDSLLAHFPSLRDVLVHLEPYGG